MSKITLLFVSCMVLFGCGVKPSSVQPPAGSENSTFPHEYPRPEAVK